MHRRPWRVEQMTADGSPIWRIVATFSSEPSALKRKADLEADNPGVTYRVEKSVEFEATH